MVGIVLIVPPVGSFLRRLQILPRVIAETTLRRKRRRIFRIVVLERGQDGTLLRKSTCLIGQEYEGVLYGAEILGIFVSDEGSPDQENP